MEEMIIEKFSIIEDFRCECNVRHKLSNILILIMCAVLCGIDNTKSIVDYGKNKGDFLSKHFGFSDTPSEATLSRILAVIDVSVVGTIILEIMGSGQSTSNMIEYKHKKTNIKPRYEMPGMRLPGQPIKKRFNRSGTQRCISKECGATHTIDPKRRDYPEETKEAAIKAYYSGATGRGVGRLFGMSKANVYNWIKKRNDCG